MGSSMRDLLEKLCEDSGMTKEFIQASSHPYTCRCDKCLSWWRMMGPDEDSEGNPRYGPFTKEEVEGSEE